MAKINKQKKQQKLAFTHVLNVVTVALIVECFLCAILAVRMYARNDCFDRIEENAVQVSEMFYHSLNERGDKLTVFADILAANSENPEALLQVYMENFCKTQYFSALCIHRANGATVYYGEHPHEDGINMHESFEVEANKLPYVSNVFFYGDSPGDSYIYQAVPIVRNDEIIAILYGYTSLDKFPTFITSTAYGGKARFYIVDGNTGNLLMDEYHGKLLNIFSQTMSDSLTRQGYDYETMKERIKEGKSGYLIFSTNSNAKWYYTYYTPLELGEWSKHSDVNWTMQMTIDETTAFEAYNDVGMMVLLLMVIVIVLMFVHVIALMIQNASKHKHDKESIHKAGYISAVQRALLNAHNNPDFVDQALKIIAEEMKAETVLLLSFSDKVVTNAQYWPSKDKAQAMNMVGRNIRDDFPTLFDLISSNTSVLYDGNDADIDISDTTKLVFENLEVSNMVLVPITDTAGVLKGAIASVNVAELKDAEMLECVTYDFFMALTNLENHNIIKRMGTLDYLTGMKNRNCYESEIIEYMNMDCDDLWCMYVDVNGLHEVNNSKGHKAGDKMLCAVADAIRRVFGEKNTFRLGGDEFIAFTANSSEEVCLKKKKLIMSELAAKDYYVSIGFDGGKKDPDGTFDVDRIVSGAEAIMYTEKWKFYEAHNLTPDRGHFPGNKD